ncbi:hypothetical protein L6164_031014 [Bauhinia variegata]|uniref:Uncharacterized protein n=1 Tax=Bauhinia variegata TaxID=167791 RepID=A0ACB9LDJ9_BAUVA|nr:hypothetical protein L6164_031014 [Bauhinia variegata]
MTVHDRCFVEWKEQFISQERGNRVVHYYLKDSAGESILAVVGTERSVRHMFYVVADEFVEVYAKEGSIHAGFKWRSRREVVDWLTSLLSKQHLPGERIVSSNDNLAQAHENTDRDSGISEIGALHAQLANDKGLLMSSFKGLNSDIVWSGVAWTCGKQLKHYPSFCRNGIKIVIQSFVFVMAKGEDHYIAYLEDMYEDRRGQKKVKVRWFHHNQEVKDVIPVRNPHPHPREVFITPYSQVISVECIDGPATVLTREHYEKYSPAFSPASSDKIHFCSRQIRSNKVKSFDLSKLRGYFDQPILSYLHLDSFQNPESKSNSLTAEEDEELSAGNDARVGAKRTRTDKGSPCSWIDHQGFRKLIRSKKMMVPKTFENVNCAQPDRRLLPLKQDEFHPLYNHIYKVDDKVELLCQDSGIRGCWFRCTILLVSRKQMKVRYDDVQEEDGSSNLEEWIRVFKLAMPDKLGMRHAGRPTIRPAPSFEKQGELAVEIGTAVDAWWSDGWWEGIVSGIENCSDNDNVLVYFPGEGLLQELSKKDLRISRDWLGDRWVDVKGKPDIVSTVIAVNSSNAKPFVSPFIAKDVDSAGTLCHEVPVINGSKELDTVNEKLVSPECCAEDVDFIHDNGPPSPNENGTQDDNIEIHVDCTNEKNDDDGNGKESDEGGDNKDDNEGRGMEVSETYGQDCKTVELMQVTV